MQKTIRLRATLLAGVLAISLAAQPAMAGSGGAEVGYGAGSALTSLVYAPVKIVYAVLGTVFGGFAWAFSAGDSEVAKAVITPAVYGDYVVTPAVLRGEDHLEFIGRGPSDTPPPPAAVAEGPYTSHDDPQSW